MNTGPENLREDTIVLLGDCPKLDPQRILEKAWVNIDPLFGDGPYARLDIESFLWVSTQLTGLEPSAKRMRALTLHAAILVAHSVMIAYIEDDADPGPPEIAALCARINLGWADVVVMFNALENGLRAAVALTCDVLLKEVL